MTATWDGVRRILAVRLDALGDLLMTEPALAALSGGGRRHVTLLASVAGARAAPLLPSVDEVIPYAAPWMKATSAADAAADLRMIERLRDGGFDAAVIFSVETQSPLPAAVVCHLAGIPRRAAHCRENPYRLLTEWHRDEGPAFARHEVERQLDLVRSLGFAVGRERMTIRVPAADRASVLRRLHRAGLDIERPWLVLHPGASVPSRRYPPERFGQAAGRLAREDGWQVVVAGGSDDGARIEAVRGAMCAASIPLAGRLSLGEVAAAISMAGLFIGNNSGPMHLAAAVGTPSVVLYAQTNPQHTPWQVSARVLQRDVPCRNCLRSVCPLGHHACLRLIAPDEIVDAARSIVSGMRPAAAPA